VLVLLFLLFSNKGTSCYTTVLQNRYVLIVVDDFSRFAMLIPLKGKSAQDVAEASYLLICDKEPMKRLHSDQREEFCNEILDKLA
jgi:hypothetical protein